MEPHVSELWHFEEGSQISVFYRTNILSKTFIPYCSHDCAKTFPHSYAMLRGLVQYKNAFFVKLTTFSTAYKTKYETKSNNDSESASQIKVRSRWKVFEILLTSTFKKFCMETRLLNISKTTYAKDFIKVILKSSCRVLLDTSNLMA